MKDFTVDYYDIILKPDGTHYKRNGRGQWLSKFIVEDLRSNGYTVEKSVSKVAMFVD